MDFRNAKELLKVCQEQGLSISAVMLQRELTEGEQDPEETDRKMDRVLQITKIPEKVFAEIFWKELSFTRWQLWKPMLPWV